MKKSFRKRMDEAYSMCPGAVLGRMPASEIDAGHLLIEPGCCKAALDFLKRRFHVEEKEIVESTGELKFVITPRLRRTASRPAPRRYIKPIQYELPL
jgi:hypothetical protein